MWHVTLTGNPRAIGEQYATLLGPKLLYYLEEVKKALGGAKRAERMARIVGRTGETLRTVFPDLSEELEGCAATLGVSPDDMVMLVAFNDLWWGLDWGAVSENAPRHFGDCTSLGFRRECDEPMLGQTLDAPDVGQFCVHTLYPDRGYALLSVHRVAPSQAWYGINQCGVCCAGVSSGCRSQNLDGLPINVILRVILQTCASVDAAVKVMRAHRLLSGGYTVQVMQRDGRSVVLECAAAGVEVIESDKPYLYNTRFTSERMRRLYEGMGSDATTQRAESRLRTFDRLLRQEPRPYSIETMKRVLSDHSPEGPIWAWTTPMAVMMFPNRGSLDVYEGPPNYAWAERYVLRPEASPGAP